MWGFYEVVKFMECFAYEFKFPIEVSLVLLVFHVSMPKNWIGDPVSILPLEGLEVDANHSYEEVSVEILEWKLKNLRNKEIASVKILWKSHLVENDTWEAEADMMSRYSNHFPPSTI